MRRTFLLCLFLGLFGISSSLPVSTRAGGGPGPSMYVRAGTSTPYTDPSGNVWTGDADYSGGTEYATTHAINNTTTQPLYQTERYGGFTYTFNGLPIGSPYAVTLKFSEDYWTAASKRIFNVILNGKSVLSNFDIFADSGGEYIADDKTFNTTVNSSGQIVIQFQNGSVDNAKIDAIQLVPSTPPLPTPQISIIPSSVNFGNVVTGVTNTQTLTIRNPGADNLSVTLASISGTGFGSSGLALPLTVAPGGSSSLTVKFSPTTASNFSGSLTLVNNSPTSPLVVALSGAGISPALQLSASPASISFGSLTTGTTASQSVTLSNVGNANVSLSQLTVSPSAFSASRLAVPMTLAPGQSASVSVTFSPTTAVSYQGSVTVTSNATNSPTAISLSGSGTAAATHSSILSWTPSASSYTGFNVYRGSQSGGPYTRLNSALVFTPSYTDTDVAAGQTYYYVVTEVNSIGAESAYSNVVVATIP
jgi:Malectin domain/Abnormal spindle-like microcephaly-assoc'd, ASPM-SPD-2-Hydin